MKNIYRILIAALAALIATSCLGDLDTQPIDESINTSEKAYADESSYLMGLAYINAYWCFVSQTAPDQSDITAPDAGQGELLRQFVNLQEMTADALKCTWGGDPYVADLCYNTWTTSNTALNIVYTRCVKAIALVNEFLLQTEDSRLDARGHQSLMDAVHGYRAEARFHRAMYFWALMDLFGNPPFPMPENIGGEMPSQIKRSDLFNWLEEELLSLLEADSDMPKKGEVNYPRPTQGSVAALLARMYLNAQVYTGTARWQDAKDMAAKVIAMGYSLNPVYENIFKHDNTESGAAEKEFIFGIEYDKDHAQSWGGATTLGSAFFDDSRDIVAYLLGYPGNSITPGKWNGYHVPDSYVSYFELKGVKWNDPDASYTYHDPSDPDWNGDGNLDGEDDKLREKQEKELPNYSMGYDMAASDKRAFFFNQGKPDFDNSAPETGWRCWKFSGRYTDGSFHTADFASMDFPLIRLAEMYLIYAEADARLNGGKVSSSEAKGYLKALRDRAGVAMPADGELTLDWILAERARELMLEGHRRTDLIRYGYYTSASFPWPYKGGIKDGRVSLPEYRTIFPIIEADRNANMNLEQNPGY